MKVKNKRLAKPSKSVAWRAAFFYWLKLGFISFGGPAGQIAVMHQDIVNKKHWLSEKRFLHALNFCMVLPGPEAQQLATYIGWLMHRFWGGLMAGGLFVLPSFFMLAGLGYCYMVYGNLPWVAGMFYSIKAAVVAIVFFACYRIGGRVLKNNFLYFIAAGAFVGGLVGLPFPLMVVMAAAIGFFGNHYYPAAFHSSNHHPQTNQQAKKIPYVIDDRTIMSPRARFTKKKFAVTLLGGLALWGLAMAGLIFIFGWHHITVVASWFFTKAALLTFGGAYAVLPYVYQGAVVHYNWLSAAQMIDGLALGESTPGPLIMVITFIGFVTGWESNFLSSPLWSAMLLASVVTFFTFLPSFVMIFLGAPLIETTRNNIKLTAPLTAITAAVVGVILNLALFFVYHVFWPNGFAGDAMASIAAIDWFAVAVALLALMGLIRFKLSTLQIIIASAAVGVVRGLL